MFEPDYRHRGLAIAAMAAGLVVLVGAALWALSSLSSIGSSPRSRSRSRHRRSEYGTKREIGTQRRRRRIPACCSTATFPSDNQTQERRVGGPAGSLQRVHHLGTCGRTRVPARTLRRARIPGVYLRVRVTVFNRDSTEPARVRLRLLRVDARRRDTAKPTWSRPRPLASDTDMNSGARRDGDVYLYVGMVPGPFYVVYNPDDARVAESTSTARGVWLVPVSTRDQASRAAIQAVGPPSTPG